MSRHTLPVIALATVCPQIAAAQDTPIFSFDTTFGVHSREGNALNMTGPGEASNFVSYDINGLVSFTTQDGLAFQLEAGLQGSSVGETVQGFTADDSAQGSTQYAIQVGYHFQDAYLGGFVAYQRSNFTNFDLDQNSETWAYGLNAAYHVEDWTFGAQLGMFNASAANMEVLDDAYFARLSATYFFDNDNTAVGAHMSLVNGIQDSDDIPVNDLLIYGFGMHFEHAFDGDLLGGQPSVFAAVDYFAVLEDSTCGCVDRVDEVQLEVGFRITFGAQSVQDRTRRTAPQIVSLGDWQGTVPLVD